MFAIDLEIERLNLLHELVPDEILGGAKPADMPVVQSAKVELVVNFKAAITLGLKIPASVLARAGEVID